MTKVKSYNLAKYMFRRIQVFIMADFVKRLYLQNSFYLDFIDPFEIPNYVKWPIGTWGILIITAFSLVLACVSAVLLRPHFFYLHEIILTCRRLLTHSKKGTKKEE